jgi:hypothetical protein
LHPSGGIQQQDSFEHVLEKRLLTGIFGRLRFGAAGTFLGELIAQRGRLAALSKASTPHEQGSD